MSGDRPPPSSSHTVILVTVAGAFIGLLLGKFALGLILGSIVGVLLAAARRAPAASGDKTSTPGPPASG